MRIVDRKTFLALPAGTFYREGEPWAFGDLCLKHDTLGTNDWVEQHFENPEAKSSDELFDRFEEMLQQEASYPLDAENTMRNGMFEDDSIFLIYEANDLRILRDAIDKVIEVGT